MFTARIAFGKTTFALMILLKKPERKLNLYEVKEFAGGKSPLQYLIAYGERFTFQSEFRVAPVPIFGR